MKNLIKTPCNKQPNNKHVKIAHIRKSDGKIQTVAEHLLETAELAGEAAEKIGFRDEGFLLGLLHDFGKYSQAFQNYIRSEEGLINPDEDA